MAEKILCTVCGKMFDAEYCQFLDNGNPACPRCSDEEDKRLEDADCQNEEN